MKQRSHFGNLFHATSSGKSAVVSSQMSPPLFDLIVMLIPLISEYIFIKYLYLIDCLLAQKMWPLY